jgi:MbtH protein
VSDIQQKRMNAYMTDGDSFIAPINDEEQYSIWPAKKEIPAGWNNVGFSRSKQGVSAYIDEHWTDMRSTTRAVMFA